MRIGLKVRACAAGVGVIVLAMALSPAVRARVRHAIRPRADVAGRIAELGTAARDRMRDRFERAGVRYPPVSVVLVGLKQERTLEVYAAGMDGAAKFVRSYPILGASGKAGPKLAEGDYQVPEGIYACELLNPNSLYHLALRVGYPNDDDRAHAAADGRARLGGDIMIHGGAGSVGCLAMGDPAIEELFVLAADVGVERIEIVLSPVDFRVAGRTVETSHLPTWVGGRYDAIRQRLDTLPRP